MGWALKYIQTLNIECSISEILMAHSCQPSSRINIGLDIQSFEAIQDHSTTFKFNTVGRGSTL
jgi:hypothetical protein